MTGTRILTDTELDAVCGGSMLDGGFLAIVVDPQVSVVDQQQTNIATAIGTDATAVNALNANIANVRQTYLHF